MQWHINHPSRYEVTHVMGPLTVARLNAEYDCALDLDRVLTAWFGDGDTRRMPWKITAGTRFGGIPCDGLDGVYWGGAEEGFHAFSMGTLQGPALLVPMFLFFNPHATAKTVEMCVGPQACDLYDVVSNRFLKCHVHDVTTLILTADRRLFP